jgi:hypothetical protein
MTFERFNKTYTIVLLLVLGVVMVFVRRLYTQYFISFLFDVLLYALAGYFAGNHLYYKRWRWGVLPALPAMLVILYFFFSASASGTMGNRGLKNIISFIAIPTSACAGIWVKNNRRNFYSITGLKNR